MAGERWADVPLDRLNAEQLKLVRRAAQTRLDDLAARQADAPPDPAGPYAAALARQLTLDLEGGRVRICRHLLGRGTTAGYHLAWRPRDLLCGACVVGEHLAYAKAAGGKLRRCDVCGTRRGPITACNVAVGVVAFGFGCCERCAAAEAPQGRQAGAALVSDQ